MSGFDLPEIKLEENDAEEEEEEEVVGLVPPTIPNDLIIDVAVSNEILGHVIGGGSSRKKKKPPKALLKRLRKKTFEKPKFQSKNRFFNTASRYYKPTPVRSLLPSRKPMSYYKRKEKKEMKERMNFLLHQSSHHPDLTFLLPNGKSFRSFQSLFPIFESSNQKPTKEMIVTLGKNAKCDLFDDFLTDELLLEVLIGEPKKLTPTQLLGLGEFFREIGYPQALYCICVQIKRIKNLQSLLSLLKLCVTLFERPIEKGAPVDTFFKTYEEEHSNSWKQFNDQYQTESRTRIELGRSEDRTGQGSSYLFPSYRSTSNPVGSHHSDKIFRRYDSNNEYHNRNRGFPVQSVFTLLILGALKERFHEIKSIRMYVDFLERMNYLSYVMLDVEDAMDFIFHPQFGQGGSATSVFSPDVEIICDTFPKLWKKNMKQYYQPLSTKRKRKRKTRKLGKKVNTQSVSMIGGCSRGNVVLYCPDGEEFLVHKEVLILKSNMFYKILKFPGSEYVEEREVSRIKIEILNSRELSCLLDYMYLSKVQTSDYQVLVRLVELSEMFFEYTLQEYLFSKISSLFMIAFEGNLLEITLLKSGHLFNNLPEELKSRFFDRLVLKKEVVENLVKQSIKSKSEEERKQRSEENKEKTIENLRKVIEEKEKRIRILKMKSEGLKKMKEEEEDGEDT